MKQITIKLKDNTEIQINKRYTDIFNELNDTRTDFINIKNYIFAKDTIAYVVLEEISGGEQNDSNNI